MLCFDFRRSLAIGIAGLIAVLGEPSTAQSMGFAKTPGRPAQFFGYGHGAGHQAPIVRTPGQHPDRASRMAIARPKGGPLHPMAYAPIGCYGEACLGNSPVIYSTMPAASYDHLMRYDVPLFTPPAPVTPPR